MNFIIEKLSSYIRNTKFNGKVYIVGGFVRDIILNRSSYDIDVLVDLPAGGIELAVFLHNKGLVSKPVIFPRFGTAQVQWNGYQLEFVMCRQESYQKGSRKPTVNSASLYSDILRRDFTINTLLLDLSTGKILDLTGRAKQDIAAKLVKTTQEPAFIFQEDPLRMLRAVRFAVQLGFQVEEKSFAAISLQAACLKNISWERKRDELSKIMLSAEPARGMEMLQTNDLLKFLIPELLATVNCRQNQYHYQDVWKHTLQVLQNTKAVAELRWAALMHDVGKPQAKSRQNGKVHFYGHETKSAGIIAKVLKRLKFSNKFISEVVFLVKNHLRTQNYGPEAEKVSDKKIRKLVFDSGEMLAKLLQLIHADNLAKSKPKSKQIPKLKQRIKNLEFSTETKPPINGKDIMQEFGLNPGIKVGELLKQAEKIWLEHPGWDKDKLLAAIKKKWCGRSRT